MKLCGLNIELTDFYCQGYRYFNDMESEKRRWLEIIGKPKKQQWYGQGVIIFSDIQELNETINKLILLRDSINLNIPKISKIQKEFGTNNLDYNC